VTLQNIGDGLTIAYPEQRLYTVTVVFDRAEIPVLEFLSDKSVANVEFDTLNKSLCCRLNVNLLNSALKCHVCACKRRHNNHSRVFHVDCRRFHRMSV